MTRRRADFDEKIIELWKFGIEKGSTFKYDTQYRKNILIFKNVIILHNLWSLSFETPTHSGHCSAYILAFSLFSKLYIILLLFWSLLLYGSSYLNIFFLYSLRVRQYCLKLREGEEEVVLILAVLNKYALILRLLRHSFTVYFL